MTGLASLREENADRWRQHHRHSGNCVQPGRAGTIENLCRRVPMHDRFSAYENRLPQETVHPLRNVHLQLIPDHYAGPPPLAGVAAPTTWPWSCGRTGMPARTS